LPLQAEEASPDDLNIEILFDDQLVVAAGARSKWAPRRRKIDLAELIEEPWIMQAPHSWNYRNSGGGLPHARPSPCQGPAWSRCPCRSLRIFLADGRFITALPRSVAYFKSLNVLPVRLAGPAMAGQRRDAEKIEP